MKLKGGMTFDKSKGMISHIWKMLKKKNEDESRIKEIDNYWEKIDDSEVTDRGVCWLFCWADSTRTNYENEIRKKNGLWEALFDYSMILF